MSDLSLVSIGLVVAAAFLAGYCVRPLKARLLNPGLDGGDLPQEPGPDQQPLAWLSDLVELLPCPLLLIDRQGALIHANLAVRDSYGDVVSSLLRHPALDDTLLRVDGGDIVSATVKLDVPVARALQVSIRALPHIDPGLLVLALSDQTQQEAVERMRADFVANASHELRTPLASLIGFIDTLLGPAADDVQAQRRFLAIMQTQAARMRRLIDNLMSLSRIQLMEHDRPRGRVDLAPVIANVADGLEPLLQSRNIELKIDLASGLPSVRGDADQVAQVLQNLLDNALKYATRRITLSASPVQGGVWPAAAGVVLAVRDDGPGIAAHHLPRLTERFYRVEEGQAGRVGSGLGLAIVKHIVGRHSGRLQIESSQGKGSLFSVWLPRA
ncbi:sensor histidine kinase [Lichenicoccus roseus]|uniref:sensor histidine kinase n=1 Tax=Lichenicoccus roseus TaxID=2683649 RepID=UPI001485F3FF|nr:ATP-binding protein [Lichenicoccus roseus]